MDPGLRREDNKGRTGVNLLNESEPPVLWSIQVIHCNTSYVMPGLVQNKSGHDGYRLQLLVKHSAPLLR